MKFNYHYKLSEIDRREREEEGNAVRNVEWEYRFRRMEGHGLLSQQIAANRELARIREKYDEERRRLYDETEEEDHRW